MIDQTIVERYAKAYLVADRDNAPRLVDVIAAAMSRAYDIGHADGLAEGAMWGRWEEPA